LRFEDLNWKDILMEAPEDTGGEEEELSATDYTDAENLDIEQGSPDDELDDEMDLEGDDEDLDLDVGEEGDLESEGEGEENLDDETLDEEQTDNDEESNDIISEKQNKYLVHDFIELYKRMDTILTEIRSSSKVKLHINPNILSVRKNIEKLKEVTYVYLTDKFAKETYVANLYQFNLIIQALNVNVELLDAVIKNTTNKKE
jgi:hypothetical protein